MPIIMSQAISIPIITLMFAISSASLGPDDVDTLLKTHNDERGLTQLSALLWDAGFEATATQWATTCPDGHSSDGLRKGASENLGWGWPTINASGTVQAWIVEKADLVNGVCNAGKQCGHYQEIISPNITALGCATATNCSSSKVSGQSVMQVWVCHYGKSSGNSTTPAPAANNSSPASTPGSTISSTPSPTLASTSSPANASMASPTDASTPSMTPALIPSPADASMPSLTNASIPSTTDTSTPLPTTPSTPLPTTPSTPLPTTPSTPFPRTAATAHIPTTLPNALTANSPSLIGNTPEFLQFVKLMRRPIPIVNRYDSGAGTCDD